MVNSLRAACPIVDVTLGYICANDRKAKGSEISIRLRNGYGWMAGQHCGGLLGVEGSFPFGHHYGGDAVADDVDDGTGYVGEAFDAEEQDESGDWDLVHGGEGGGEGDEAGAGDSGGAFGGEHEDDEDDDLVAQAEV